VLGGLVAVAGHNWPIWLSFKGGRGVATALGVILMLVPKITLIVVCIFALVVYFTRYVSLGSIAAAVLVPLLMLWFREPLSVLVFGVVASFFVVIRHRANIGRLMKGTELKISWGGKSSSDAEKR
jgi:glycerol-3-phosphate acyltransferase PlsY